MEELKLGDVEVELNPVISVYMKKGWVFYRDEWHNGHNGNLETDYQFRSPRMSKPSTLHTVAQFRGMSALSEDGLLDAEAGVLAHRFIDDYEDDLKDRIHEILKKRLRRGGKIDPDDLKIKFTVTVKPK